MVNVNIEDSLYKDVKKFIKRKENSIDYPSVKNFVDKAIRRFLEKRGE